MIDALDELAHGVQRRDVCSFYQYNTFGDVVYKTWLNNLIAQILALLCKWASGMPRWARIFMTARPEDDVVKTLNCLNPRILVFEIHLHIL